MAEDFKTIEPQEIPGNVIKLIGREWMLVTAGDVEDFNTMTASWGGMGELWNLPVSFVFVRPQRYTYQFMERAGTFSLTFFEERYRPALNYCGTYSGRDVDKMAETGLTPAAAPSGTVYFAEARLVLLCEKLYARDLTGESFVDAALRDKIYPTRDFHRMYVGRIKHVLIR